MFKRLLGLFVLSLTVAWCIAFAAAPAHAAQTFNVKKFGATGNGVTNDTAAILAALAAANAVPGSTLEFPAGNYLYSSNLPANGILIVGHDATLTSENSSSSLQLSGHRVSVQGMTFASQASDALALTVDQACGFQVSSNTFAAGLGLDMAVTNSSNGRIRANSLFLSGKSSVLIMGQSSLISIHDNSVTSNSSTTSGFVFGSCNNISVISNTMKGVAGCIVSGESQTISVMHNEFSGFSNFGLVSGSDSNLTISGNQFSATHIFNADLILGSDQNVLISDNRLQTGVVGVQSGSCTNIQISGNTVSNMQFFGLLLGSDTTMIASLNTIKNTGTAMLIADERNVTVNGNHISQCQNNGIVEESCSGTDKISDNEIRDCGLASGTDPAAVIFVNSSGATSIPIIHNFYGGNTANLQFFIRCIQPQPPAKVSGNFTPTMLPSQIGP